MGFLDTLRRVLGVDDAQRNEDPALRGLVTESAAAAEASGATEGAVDFDRAQWRKKLKRILEELPASQAEWDALMYEARALDFDPSWVVRCQGEEFLLLIRRVVSDRIVTESEHEKLDLARRLIGLSELEAETVLLAVVAEAESFFGKPVRKDEVV